VDHVSVRSDGEVRYPAMRAEVVDAVRAFADPDYQWRVWVRLEYPTKRFYDDFSMRIKMLDDLGMIDDPAAAVGDVLRNQAEASALEPMNRALKALFDKHGTKLTDEEYLTTPEWTVVVDTARAALGVLTDPLWWKDLTSAGELLADADRALVEEWGYEDDLPLTLRLGGLGRAFAQHAHDLTAEQRRRVLEVLERVLASGTEYDRTAVATGFIEAFVHAADNRPDLDIVWAEFGPESRAYIEAWNAFTGAHWPRKP
jgi:hypothetical protein